MDRREHSRHKDTNSTFVGRIPAEQHKMLYTQLIGRPDRMFTLRYGCLRFGTVTNIYTGAFGQTDSLFIHSPTWHHSRINDRKLKTEDSIPVEYEAAILSENDIPVALTAINVPKNVAAKPGHDLLNVLNGSLWRR